MVILNSGFLSTRHRISPKITRNISTRPQQIHQPCPRPESWKNFGVNGRQIITLPGVPTCLGPARCGFNVCCWYHLPQSASVNKCCLWHTRFDIFIGVIFSVIFANANCVCLESRISSQLEFFLVHFETCSVIVKKSPWSLIFFLYLFIFFVSIFFYSSCSSFFPYLLTFCSTF
jgi:hypothetical protein